LLLFYYKLLVEEYASKIIWWQYCS